jgi:membrane associated rhomboid family serine protease
MYYFFVGTLAVGDRAYDLLLSIFPENSSFQYWQPNSCLCTEVYAYFFNMFALYSFGSALEHFGRGKVLFFTFPVVLEH